MSTGDRSSQKWPTGAGTPSTVLELTSMQNNATPDLQDSGTTDDRTDTDCDCTALMPCFEHYLAERGRPAIRRIN